MINKSLIRLSKEVGRVSVPSYIHSFLAGHPNIRSFESAYTELLEWLPDGVPVPTLNEAILYYNMAKLQKIADAQLLAIRLSEDKLKDLLQYPELNSKEIAYYEHNIAMKEKKYHEIARDLTRLANSGVDRETPKNININQTTVIGLSDIHEKIREIKNITPEDAKH